MTMDTHGYRAELRYEDDGSWTAEVPELPGSVAGGMSPDEAVTELADAIKAWLTSAGAAGSHIPPPIEPDTDYSGRFVVRVGHSLHRALAVLAAREGVSLNSVCQTLLAYGVGRSEAPAWRITTAPMFYTILPDTHTLSGNAPLLLDDFSSKQLPRPRTTGTLQITSTVGQARAQEPLMRATR